MPSCDHAEPAEFADTDAGESLDPMSREALLEGVKRGDVTLLDVRPEAEFRAGHLPDAINAPVDRLEEMMEQLPRNQEIVAYCRGPWCVLSHEAIRFLRRRGFRVRRYEEGYPEWRAAGLPVAAGG